VPDLLTVAGIALKTSLLIAAAALLALALRRQSAAFRHLLWTSALGLCVLMPLAVFLLPSHTIATLPAIPSSARAGGLGWVLALWIAGSSCILVRELVSSLGLARWLRHAHPLESARWAATLAHFDCRVRVLESQHIASPFTSGLLTPVLLLPSAGDAWPESGRRSALLHELAHVRRHDTVSALISRLACVLHWYNPLVWLAAAHARSLQERACDDAVLRAGAIPSEYAQFLLDVAARMSGLPRPSPPAIGMAHSSLRTRIVAILDPRTARSQPRHASVLAACATLFATTVLLGMASVETLPKLTPQVPVLPAVSPVPAVPAVPAIPAVPPQLPKLPTSPTP
jgi:beta-lactamase regulating signal transducer with metallopeptidase domain